MGMETIQNNEAVAEKEVPQARPDQGVEMHDASKMMDTIVKAEQTVENANKMNLPEKVEKHVGFLDKVKNLFRASEEKIIQRVENDPVASMALDQLVEKHGEAIKPIYYAGYRNNGKFQRYDETQKKMVSTMGSSANAGSAFS